MRIQLFGITITIERGLPAADVMRVARDDALSSSRNAWTRYESSKVVIFEALKGEPEYSVPDPPPGEHWA